jgi:hypothetical protein
MAYDPKAVKVSKSIKRMASTYVDNHQRRAFIKSYVRMLESELHQRTSRRSKGDRKDSE